MIEHLPRAAHSVAIAVVGAAAALPGLVAAMLPDFSEAKDVLYIFGMIAGVAASGVALFVRNLLLQQRSEIKDLIQGLADRVSTAEKNGDALLLKTLLQIKTEYELRTDAAAARGRVEAKADAANRRLDDLEDKVNSRFEAGQTPARSTPSRGRALLRT